MSETNQQDSATYPERHSHSARQRRRLGRRKPALLVGFVLVGALATACGGDEAGGGGGGGDEEGGEFVIGAPLELSGPASSFGTGVQRGLDAAVERINAAGGVQGQAVRVEYADTESDVDGAISAVNDLLLEKEVPLIFGPVGSTSAYTAGGIIEQYEPLWVIPGASTTLVEEEWGAESWMFHPYSWDRDYSRSMVSLLAESDLPGKRVAIVYPKDAYGEEHLKAATQYYEEAGFEIVFESAFQPETSDFSSLLAQVQSTNPDIFHGIAQTADGIALTRAVQQAQLSVDIYADNNFPTLDEWLEASGKGADYWLGVAPYSYGVRFPASEEYPELLPDTETWEADMEEKYNRRPDVMDALGYNAAMTTFIGINEADSLEQEDIIAALESLETMTPMGPFKYEESEGGGIHSAYGDMLVVQIQDGERHVVYPEEAATADFIAEAPPR